ncbi:MAG TPA: TIGR03668 family PPOX class F420-dependent oxidoreductase [Solirubrobacteraceae bacterium]|nr:TIGR03668 family PPOX class F420-dependent oxidoreductase [Solirubrobacteraceae bacterium]
MDADQVREYFDRAPVARLATIDTAAHRPHLVPVTFARLDPDTLVTGIDHKPKRTRALRRLQNIAGNPNVCVLADHYEDDWTQLWWVRADGTAQVREASSAPEAVRALVARYPQYAERPLDGPVIVISVVRWTGWVSASAAG